MKRKIIVGFVIIGLILTTMPLGIARSPKLSIFEKYSECYIEISGLLSINDYPRIIGTSMWKLIFLRPDGSGTPAAYVFYWYLMFDKTASITIYTEENGDILWQHDGIGEPEIRILKFSGDYISYEVEEGRLNKDIIGNVQTIWINQR
jgi:hypothetical protein